jgi:superfamily I DNA and/or RNA helicase
MGVCTLSATIKALKEFVTREKYFAIREMIKESKTFNAQILGFSGNVLDLYCSEWRNFEVGDVIGFVEYGDINVFGNVIDSNLGIVSVYLNLTKESSEEYFSEERDVRIFEAEPLISYDLQLNLIERIDSGWTNEAVELFFGNPHAKPINKTYRLTDRKCLGNERCLDESQVEAVENILSLDSGDFLLIIGPPGCGKTTVIKKAAYHLVMDKGEKVLVTSNANRAVDNAIEDLDKHLEEIGCSCVRVGRPEKVDPKLYECMPGSKFDKTLRAKIQHLEGKIEEAKKERAEILQRAKFHDVSDELRRNSEKMASLYAERNELLKKGVEKVVEGASVVGSTIVKSQLYPLAKINFDTCVIDESSQVPITMALLAMIKAKKWVLIGDNKQLLPIFRTVRRQDLQEILSAFVYLLKKYENRSLWLKWHYRSNTQIIEFPSRFIYNEMIKPSPECSKVKLQLRVYKLEVLDPEKPVVFVHTRGRAERKGSSLRNEREVEVCSEIVKNLVEADVDEENIGVITPYRAQKRELRSNIKYGRVEIDTVDAFQGREKDVIILSLTATEDLRFAANINRVNVALTRPRSKLIVVGNGMSIMQNPESILYKFLKYAYEKRAVFDWDWKQWIS